MKASPDHSTTETVFTARGLSKVYAVGEMEVRALHDVDLDVYAHVEPGGFTKISTLGVEEQRVNVIVDILSPREAWLDLGDAFQIDARIEILTVDDALVVPSGVLFRKEGAWHTYVVRDGRAELRPVDVLRRSGGLAAIAKGLEPGDQVIVYPSDSVAPSVRVKPR